MTPSSFVLVGTILSFDTFRATVQFDTNPPSNGGGGLAVMPVEAIPCEVEVGKKVYVVKYEKAETPTISCQKQEEKK